MKNINTLIFLLLILCNGSALGFGNLRTKFENKLIWLIRLERGQLLSIQKGETKAHYMDIKNVLEHLDSLANSMQHPASKHIAKCLYQVTLLADSTYTTVGALVNNWNDELGRLEAIYQEDTQKRDSEGFMPAKEMTSLRRQLLRKELFSIKLSTLLSHYSIDSLPSPRANDIISFSADFQRRINDIQASLSALKDEELQSKIVSLELLQQNKKMMASDDLISQKAIEQLLQTIEINIEDTLSVKSLTERMIGSLEILRTDYAFFTTLCEANYPNYDNLHATGIETIRQWILAAVKP